MFASLSPLASSTMLNDASLLSLASTSAVPVFKVSKKAYKAPRSPKKVIKAKENFSEQKSSSAAMMASSSIEHEVGPSSTSSSPYTCFCGTSLETKNGYLRHLRKGCRMHDMCLRIQDLISDFSKMDCVLTPLDVSEHLTSILKPYIPNIIHSKITLNNQTSNTATTNDTTLASHPVASSASEILGPSDLHSAAFVGDSLILK